MAEKQPLFNRSISVGNILQIVVLVASVMFAWSTMDQRSQKNTEAVSATKAEIIEVKEDVQRLRDEVRRLEIDQVRSREQYNNLVELLTKIDARLERIEARQ